jgi:hypothetical protein
MARSRRDLVSSRLWLVEDLWWVLFATMILTLKQGVGLGRRTALDFPACDSISV